MVKKYYLNDHGLVTYNELIKKKISELVGFDVSVLDELPTTGVEHILYLIPSKSEIQENVRDEYLWIDEKWEMIGSTAINLDNYYTKDEIDASIQNISINALNNSIIVNDSSILVDSDTNYIQLNTSDNKLLLNSSIITLVDASNGLTGLAIAEDIYQHLANTEEVTATSIITIANKTGLDSSLNLVWSEESGLTEDNIKEAIEYISMNSGAKINDSLIDSNTVWSSQKVNNEIQAIKGMPYLKFTANTAGSTISLSNYGGNVPDIKYSRDGVTWIQWDYSAITLTNAGDYIYMKGDNSQGFSSSSSKYSQFVMTGSIAGSGNIMSLIDDGDCNTLIIPNGFCFYRLFRDCTSLTSAPELPATTLATVCYAYMFYGCSSLTSAPELPATLLANVCYLNMFGDCTSLTSAPELPATTLVDGCYVDMFSNCSRLSYIKCLATTGINNSTVDWVFGVASTGTFIKDSNTIWPTGDNGIPTGWNYIDLSTKQTYENGHIYDSSVNSIAEGVLNGSIDGIVVNQCIASGINSHAEGLGTQALNKAEHAEGTYNKSNNIIGSDFIDLGLSVKWRNKNIGAETIYDYGNYYAWGELETKTYYDWTDPNDSDQNYKYANGDWNKLTKYCNNSEYGNEGYTDELVTLEMMDDVVYQTNNSWRMPTKAECEALIALPNKWMTINNINGRVFCKTNEPGAIKGDFSIMEEGLYLYDENNQNPDSEYGSYNIYDDFDPIGLEYQTKEEVNAKLTTYYAENYGYEGTVNIDTMLFKDAEHLELAVAGTDYQFGSFPEFNQNTMLFIPASGGKYRDSLSGVGDYAYLWSSSLYEDNPYCAWYLSFYPDGISMSSYDRYRGFVVRPVLSESEMRTLHSVGIGTSNEDRRNAFEIMSNGNAYLYGVGNYDGTNSADAETLQNLLVDLIPTTYDDLLQKVNSKLLTPGKKYLITDYITKINNSDFTSLEKAYDGIVCEAISNSELSRVNCKAILSYEGGGLNEDVYIWVDNIIDDPEEFGPIEDFLQQYIDNFTETFNGDRLYRIGKIEFDNESYWLWEKTDTNDYPSDDSDYMQFVLTTIGDFEDNTIFDDITKINRPILYYLNNDMKQIDYDNNPDLGSNHNPEDWVVIRQEKYTYNPNKVSSNKIYVEKFASDNIEWDYYYDTDFYQEGPGTTNEYTLKGTLEWDDNEFYLWELTDGHALDTDQTQYSWMLTKTADFDGLSLQENHDSRYCPCYCFLNEDKSEAYFDTYSYNTHNILLIQAIYDPSEPEVKPLSGSGGNSETKTVEYEIGYDITKQFDGHKGTILYMQDEYGNSANFDFKNIESKKYGFLFGGENDLTLDGTYKENKVLGELREFSICSETCYGSTFTQNCLGVIYQDLENCEVSYDNNQFVVFDPYHHETLNTILIEHQKNIEDIDTVTSTLLVNHEDRIRELEAKIEQILNE